MGDISELRGMVACVTVLGVVVLLFLWIPPQFWAIGETYRHVIVPSEFEMIDVLSFAETCVIRMNTTGGSGYVGTYYYHLNGVLDIGNRDFTFYYQYPNQSTHNVKMHLNWYSWFMMPALEQLDWISMQGANRGGILSVDEMNLDLLNETVTDTVIVEYRLKSNTWNFEYFTAFSYNTTIYGNFTHAWDYNGLWFFMGVNFDQVNTSYSAFQLVEMLLFFQLPNVQTEINALVAIPLWVCIAYIVFILLLRAVGAIFGGGA